MDPNIFGGGGIDTNKGISALKDIFMAIDDYSVNFFVLYMTKYWDKKQQLRDLLVWKLPKFLSK